MRCVTQRALWWTNARAAQPPATHEARCIVNARFGIHHLANAGLARMGPSLLDTTYSFPANRGCAPTPFRDPQKLCAILWITRVVTPGPQHRRGTSPLVIF